GTFSGTRADGGTITTTTGNAASLVPVRAVTSTKQIVCPQAVNRFNQFTSVTINFSLRTDDLLGRCYRAQWHEVRGSAGCRCDRSTTCSCPAEGTTSVTAYVKIVKISRRRALTVLHF